jgi:hypothetical protein
MALHFSSDDRKVAEALYDQLMSYEYAEALIQLRDVPNSTGWALRSILVSQGDSIDAEMKPLKALIKPLRDSKKRIMMVLTIMRELGYVPQAGLVREDISDYQDALDEDD